MKSIFSSTRILLIVTLIVVVFSIYVDWRTASWTWFQRSGTIVALTGAILGYRSIVRLGKEGVGGSSVSFAIGKVVSTSDDGSRVTVAYDEETERRFREADLDRAAGYVGAFMAIAGTLIGGYGDLVGKLLN